MKATTKTKTQNIHQENLDLFSNFQSLQNIKKMFLCTKNPKHFLIFAPELVRLI